MAKLASIGNNKFSKITIGNKPVKYLNMGDNNAYHNNPKICYDMLDPLDIIEDFTAPQIFSNYYDPVFDINEDVIINFYFTDFYLREYRYNDTSLNFTLRYSLDGKVTTLTNLKAGDSHLNLGKLPAGEHYYSLLVIDPNGLKSRRMYYEFLVLDKVADLQDIEAHTYIMKLEDLAKYKIHNDNSEVEADIISTRLGLATFFLDLANLGYRKCVLLKGIYRSNLAEDRLGTVEKLNCAILIPSNFTVDMNGATFKLHPYWKGNCWFVQFYNCFNSHIINGTIEGGLKERDERGWYHYEDGTGAAGETENAVVFRTCKYCTLENVTITLWTGYFIMIMATDSPIIKKVAFNNNIRIVDGKEVQNKYWSSTDLLTIPQSLKDLKFLVVSPWLGYGGIRGETAYETMCFYDSLDNFITDIKVFLYTPCRIPENATKFRVTILGHDIGGMTLHFMQVAYNCKIINNTFIDNNTCMGMALFRHLLIKNNTFTNCGRRITPCEIDFEDGWEQMLDVFVIENNNAGIIDNSGINHQYLNNTDFSGNIRRGLHGLTIAGNVCTTPKKKGIRIGTGNKLKNGVRCFNNTNYEVEIDSDFDYIYRRLDRIYVKNMKQMGTINSTPFIGIYDQCEKFDLSVPENDVLVKNSTVWKHTKDAENTYIHDNIYYTDCDIKRIEPTGLMKFAFNKIDTTKIFTRCIYHNETQFIDNNAFNTGIWDSCKFLEYLEIIINRNNHPNKKGDIQFNDCVFEKLVKISVRYTDTYIQFNNCIFKGGLILSYESTKDLIEFNNCEGVTISN